MKGFFPGARVAACQLLNHSLSEEQRPFQTPPHRLTSACQDPWPKMSLQLTAAVGVGAMITRHIWNVYFSISKSHLYLDHKLSTRRLALNPNPLEYFMFCWNLFKDLLSNPRCIQEILVADNSSNLLVLMLMSDGQGQSCLVKVPNVIRVLDPLLAHGLHYYGDNLNFFQSFSLCSLKCVLMIVSAPCYDKCSWNIIALVLPRNIYAIWVGGCGFQPEGDISG